MRALTWPEIILQFGFTSLDSSKSNEVTRRFKTKSSATTLYMTLVKPRRSAAIDLTHVHADAGSFVDEGCEN